MPRLKFAFVTAVDESKDRKSGHFVQKVDKSLKNFPEIFFASGDRLTKTRLRRDG